LKEEKISIGSVDLSKVEEDIIEEKRKPMKNIKI
jgi:hypothetical protein